MTSVPERWEIEADAAFARGVMLGLRAWNERWSAEEVERLRLSNERVLDDVRLARRAVRAGRLCRAPLRHSGCWRRETPHTPSGRLQLHDPHQLDLPQPGR